MKLLCQSFLSASAVRGTDAELPPGVVGALGVPGRPAVSTLLLKVPNPPLLPPPLAPMAA